MLKIRSTQIRPYVPSLVNTSAYLHFSRPSISTRNYINRPAANIVVTRKNKNVNVYPNSQEPVRNNFNRIIPSFQHQSTNAGCGNHSNKQHQDSAFHRNSNKRYQDSACYITLIVTVLLISTTSRIEATPKFQGIPIPITLLTHQALPIFIKNFPGLEMSAVYIDGQDYYRYSEEGLMWPNACTVTIPVYKKLEQVEDARMGVNGIKKKEVGYLEMRGECKFGCAASTLVSLKLVAIGAEESVIWTWSAANGI